MTPLKRSGHRRINFTPKWKSLPTNDVRKVLAMEDYRRDKDFILKSIIDIEGNLKRSGFLSSVDMDRLTFLKDKMHRLHPADYLR
jgi:hypothetical protein